MKKKTCGIYLEYSNDEKTFAGVNLANIISEYYYRDILILSDKEIPHKDFSYRLESEFFHHMQEKDFQDYFHKCSEIFFIDKSNELFKTFKGRKILMISDAQDFRYSKYFDYLLAPNPVLYENVCKRFILTNGYKFPFAVNVQAKKNQFDIKTPVLLYPCFGASRLEIEYIDLISEIVRKGIPGSRKVLTFYNTKRKPRLGMDSRCNDVKYMEYLKKSSWIIDLRFKSFFNLTYSFASLHEIPFIQFRSELSEHEDFINGRFLIQKDSVENVANQIIETIMRAKEVNQIDRLGFSENNKVFLGTLNKIFDREEKYLK